MGGEGKGGVGALSGGFRAANVRLALGAVLRRAFRESMLPTPLLPLPNAIGLPEIGRSPAHDMGSKTEGRT
jgi:hypothetical protein